MSFSDSVLRPVAAFILAAVVANCNDGCIPGWTQLSPAEAYALEKSGCMVTYDAANNRCANEAGSYPDYTECKSEAEEQLRICLGYVERKYLGYNSNGNYPNEQPPAPSR